MEFTKEMIEKAKTVNSAEELKELENVTGGCNFARKRCCPRCGSPNTRMMTWIYVCKSCGYEWEK